MIKKDKRIHMSKMQREICEFRKSVGLRCPGCVYSDACRLRKKERKTK